MFSWKSHPRFILTLICAFWIVLTLALYLLPFFPEAELHTRDSLETTSFSRKATRNPQLVFLGVDQETESLDRLLSGELEQSRALQIIKGGKPWSRELYALIAEKLIQAGARVVVFDIRFPGPREGDEAFHRVLEKYPGQIVIGCNFIDLPDDLGEGKVSSRKALELPPPTLLPEGASDPRIGFVNVQADWDRVVRRVAYRTTLLEAQGIASVADGPEILSLAGRALERAGLADLIPSSREPVRIRFVEDFNPRSLYEIFVEAQWTKPPYRNGEFFRDKIVLIGASGNQTEDRLATPFGPMLGPAIHLSAINAALNRDFIYDPPPWTDFPLIISTTAIAWLLSVWNRRPITEIALLLGATGAYWAIAQQIFNRTGLEFSLLGPTLSMLGSGLTWSAYVQTLDQLEKRRIRRTLERYVSKDVVKEVLDNPASYLHTAGGARKKIAILFSDIRGFTALTEVADEAKLVTQLNEYFTEMVRIVFSHDGTLDKFIGDAVMAHWGGIITHGESRDACHAISTALEMLRKLVQLNAGWKARGMHELRIGLGVNYGQAICGNLGSEEKFEFSAIGDEVNLASRLEGATKEFGVDLLIGETAAPLVADRFLLRTVSLLKVSGKTHPVEVFTALGERKDTPEPAWLAPYEEGVRLYRKRSFAEALDRFEAAARADSNDALIREYLRRCRAYVANPPGPEWDGVVAMTTK